MKYYLSLDSAEIEEGMAHKCTEEISEITFDYLLKEMKGSVRPCLVGVEDVEVGVTLETIPLSSTEEEEMAIWKQIHSTYNWIAMDEDKDIYMYTKIPNICSDLRDHWDSHYIVSEVYEDTPLYGEICNLLEDVDWKDSLRKRP
jgi:hypothetical protein